MINQYLFSELIMIQQLETTNLEDLLTTRWRNSLVSAADPTVDRLPAQVKLSEVNTPRPILWLKGTIDHTAHDSIVLSTTLAHLQSAEQLIIDCGHISTLSVSGMFALFCATRVMQGLPYPDRHNIPQAVMEMCSAAGKNRRQTVVMFRNLSKQHQNQLKAVGLGAPR